MKIERLKTEPHGRTVEMRMTAESAVDEIFMTALSDLLMDKQHSGGQVILIKAGDPERTFNYAPRSG